MPKYHFIINPVSGGHRATSIVQKVAHLFTDAGFDVRTNVTRYPGHASEIVSHIELKDTKGVIVVGGDGTIHEAINGMLTREDSQQVPIGVLPAGTGNSLCHDLGFQDPFHAAQSILKNRLRRVDILEIRMGEERLYSFNVIGWGMPVGVNYFAEKMRWLRGHRYNVAALFEILRNKSQYAKITFDDNSFEGKCSIFVACNTKFSGNGMKMAPRARMDDGLIDLLLVRSTSRVNLLRLFSKVFKGQHIYDPNVSYHQVASFKLDSSPSTQLNIDGETKGRTPIEVQVLRDHVSFFE